MSPLFAFRAFPHKSAFEQQLLLFKNSVGSKCLLSFFLVNPHLDTVPHLFGRERWHKFKSAFSPSTAQRQMKCNRWAYCIMCL